MDARFIEAMPFMLNRTTDNSDLDVTFEPSGPRAKDHRALPYLEFLMDEINRCD